MNEKLVLKDGTSINIEGGTSLSDVRIISKSKKDMITTWDALSEDNLSEIQFVAENGKILATYDNIVLDSETSKIQPDGNVYTSFHLREKTEVELLREKVAQLEETQGVHDEAIADLGEAISEIAEGGTE